MKKLCLILAVMLVIGITSYEANSNDCACTIKDGIPYLPGHYLANEVIPRGFDIFGYNYQAHMFNGSYANAYLGRDGFPPYEGDTESYLAENPDVISHFAWPYRDITLMMKWSDTWLSNKDCDGDNRLDRGYSCDPDQLKFSSACEGTWLTNHQSGIDMRNGEECEWDYFVKIIYPTGIPYSEGGVWYTDDTKETEIGKVLWGAYAIIQQVDNDPCANLSGVTYKSPVGPGFGKDW